MGNVHTDHIVSGRKIICHYTEKKRIKNMFYLYSLISWTKVT